MIRKNQPADTLAAAVEGLAHTRVSDCYQCGKCSAGCPVGQRMDVLPNQLLRLVQLGRVEKALAASALWECVSCMTCTARCPKAVDCSAVMDALRQLSLEQNMTAPAQQRTITFQRAFLDNVRRHGRLAELDMIGRFKAKAFLGDGSVRELLRGALLAPKLMKRGKLHFVGKKVKDRGVVARIFERCGY